MKENIRKTISEFFNADKHYFSEEECDVFAEEVDYEGFTCSCKDGKIVFKNPFVTDEEVTWSFENTSEGRKLFVNDLLTTHKELRHNNENDKILTKILERLSEETK